MNDHDDKESMPDPAGARHRVRMPGFISADEEVGLGDVVGRATSAFGVRPCGGCMKRAAVLNQWLAFTPSGRSHG
jgi:hypothetical protein